MSDKLLPEDQLPLLLVDLNSMYPATLTRDVTKETWDTKVEEVFNKYPRALDSQDRTRLLRTCKEDWNNRHTAKNVIKRMPKRFEKIVRMMFSDKARENTKIPK